MVKVRSSDLLLNNTLTQQKKMGIAGSIGIWVGSSPPDGALLCNGAEYNTADYLDLSASLGRSSFLKFNVPNLQGKLPRGTNSTTPPPDPPTDGSLRSTGGDSTIQGIGHTHVANTSRFSSVFDDTNIERGDSDPQKYIEQFPGQQVSTITSSFNTTDTQINYLPKYLAVNFIIYT